MRVWVCGCGGCETGWSTDHLCCSALLACSALLCSALTTRFSFKDDPLVTYQGQKLSAADFGLTKKVLNGLKRNNVAIHTYVTACCVLHMYVAADA